MFKLRVMFIDGYGYSVYCTIDECIRIISNELSLNSVSIREICVERE